MNRHCYVMAIVTIVGSGIVTDETRAEGWYLGASVGRSDATLPTHPVDDALARLGFSASSTGQDDFDTAVRLTAGFEVSRYLGFEVGYTWLGETRLQTTTTDPSGTATLRSEGGGFFAQALGRLPVSTNGSAYLKLGALRWTVDSKLDIDIPGLLTDVERARARGTSPSYSVGLDYRITEHTSLRFDYEHTDELGDANRTGEADIGVLSVGLIYRM